MTFNVEPGRQFNRWPAIWGGVLAFAVLCFALQNRVPAIAAYPASWTLPLADWIEAGFQAIVVWGKSYFREIARLLQYPLDGLQALLSWLPWSVTWVLFVLAAYAVAGWRLALFTGLSLLYVVTIGYWAPAMNTLALVGVSVPMAIGLGLGLGVLAVFYQPLNRVLQPLLDFMQTVPAFAYLIPLLVLFGFGPVVGLIASIIFSIPPMVRNTILGLSRVPSDVLEAGTMAGCTRFQLFWKISLPSAQRQLLLGANQTTMAAFSMVIIAAIIGAYQDMGWEVLSQMRKSRFGNSLLSGLVIVLMAMIIDRIGQAMTAQSGRIGGEAWKQHTPKLLVGAGLVAGVWVLSLFWGALNIYPESWQMKIARPLDDGVLWLTANYADTMQTIKNSTLFFFLLPLKIGLRQAVSPFSWGVELTPAFIGVYCILIAGLAALAFRKQGWFAAVCVILAGGLIFFGTTGTPWPVFCAVMIALAWYLAGGRTALFTGFALAFFLVNGLWEPVMKSVYLCGAAVIICFLAGGLIGAWAAASDRVSAIVRPVNDTLQTMPQFALLIPALMLFQVGEFTALIAIVIYAIVPAIRYTEAGLRGVDPTVVEAARAIGCTKGQLLFRVKFPLALPEILLGLNQTILYGLAMLVITALVGTTGLGQQVYIALGKGAAGKGLVTGIAMALLAMMFDRILQGWGARKRASLGLD